MADDAVRKGVSISREMMKKNEWPVSLSVGLVTMETAVGNVDEAIKIADEVMYKVKKHGKDDVCHISFSNNREDHIPAKTDQNPTN
jgi:PleD family two-component response regulator